MQHLTAIVALALASGAYAPARAQERFSEVPQQRTVDLSRYDLSQPEDVETLYAALKRAAESACLADAAPWDVKRVMHKRLCASSALAAAVTRIDAPLLTARHRPAGERVTGR